MAVRDAGPIFAAALAQQPLDRLAFAELDGPANGGHYLVRRVDAQGREHRGVDVGHLLRVFDLAAPLGIGLADDLRRFAVGRRPAAW